MNRRTFLKTTALASAAFSAYPLLAIRPQPRKYRTLLIGSGWWGKNILRTALSSGTIQSISLCDVDATMLENAAAEFEKLTGSRPALYEDYREAIAKARPEIVIVATPDHWHALTAIAAMESGAHLFLEKPIGHTIGEGKAMVEAARATGVKVQVDLHRRANPALQNAHAFLRSGQVGEIGMVRNFVHYPLYGNDPVPDSEPPQGLNWDFWCGPAPLRPYNRKIHPGGFRQFMDYANGQCGDWGVHWLDQMLVWSEEKAPAKVSATGSRWIKKDNSDAPDTMVITYEFEKFTAFWEHRQYGGNDAEKHNIGTYFYGSKGILHMGWEDGWTFYPTSQNAQVIHESAVYKNRDRENILEMWNNLIDSIRDNTQLICDIEAGHRSTNMSLLGVAAMKAGRSLVWDSGKERFVNDNDANKLLSRSYRSPWKYPV